jgi:hypothetical protein
MTVHYPIDNVAAPQYSAWDSLWTFSKVTNPEFGFRDFKLHEEYPSLQSIHTSYEMNWMDGGAWTRATRVYWWASLLGAGLYVFFVFAGQRFMRDRKPMDLKGLLAAWNFFLAAFSIIGTIRLVSHLIYGLSINDHSYFFCRNADIAYGGSGPAGLWANLFVYSKWPELIDTVFLVLRKKPVSFLHWFHHATVMMYCWHAGQYQMPTGIFFASMNYIVHSIMYFYYFLAAITKPPKWGKMVTVLQIAQMFVGMFVTAYHYHLLKNVPNCDGSYNNLTAAFVMYTAYMLLFVQFFVEKYSKGKSVIASDKARSAKSKRE